MRSKTSCFNGTLFRKNLSRYWPLWGLASFGGAMFPLAMLLAVSYTHLDVYKRQLLHRVPRGAGDVGDDGPVIARQGIEQRRLSGIGQAHDSSADARCV